jgi:hypothetical protein
MNKFILQDIVKSLETALTELLLLLGDWIPEHEDPQEHYDTINLNLADDDKLLSLNIALISCWSDIDILEYMKNDEKD